MRLFIAIELSDEMKKAADLILPSLLAVREKISELVIA